MAESLGSSVLDLTVDSSGLEKGLAKAEGSTESRMSKMGGMFGKMAKVAAAAGAAAGASIVALGVAGLKEFSKLQSGMAEVFTLLPGISDDAMSDMTEQVRNFSREMGVLPEKTIPALYQALSAGVAQDNVFEFLEIANQAAIGGITSLETAVDGITSVVNAYGSDVISAAEASDLMFTAVRLGKTDFESLSKSLFQVIPTASALGVGFGDVTGALAQLTAQGVPTSVATTQMRQLFVELSKAGGKTDQMFREMAGQSFAEFIAGGGNVADALDIMKEAADVNGVALQDMFGSVEAGAAALGLAANGTEAYREVLAEMENSAGATSGAYDTMNGTLSRTFDRIKAGTAVAMGEIGERLAPAFATFGDIVLRIMPQVTEAVLRMFDTIGGLATRFADFMATFTVDTGNMGGLFDGLIAMAQAAFANLVTWLQTGGIETIFNGILAGRERLFDAAMRLFPVILDALVMFAIELVHFIATDMLPRLMQEIVAAVPMLIEAALTLFSALVGAIETILPLLINTLVGTVLPQLMDTLIEMAPGLLDAALEAFIMLVDAIVLVLPEIIGTLFGVVLPKVIETILKMLPQLLDAALQAFFALVTAIIEVLPSIIRTLLFDVLPAIITTIIGMMPELFQATKDLFMDMVRGIGAMIRDIGSAVLEIGAGIVDKVLGFGGDLFDSGKQIIQDLINGIKSMIGKVGDAMKDIGGRIRNFLPFSPAKEGPLSGSGSPDRSGQKIADMVADGIMAGEGEVQLAMRRITHMDVEVAAAMGRGLPMDRMAGAGIVVNVEGAIDPENTARTILRTLRDAERRTGDRLRV